MNNKSFTAFNALNYDYYRLKKDIGPLKAGAIFIHDKEDNIKGSVACGSLKLCWTPDGRCYSNFCGGSVILHPNFSKDKTLFEFIPPDDRRIEKEEILTCIERLKTNEMNKDEALNYLYKEINTIYNTRGEKNGGRQ